MKLKKLTKNSVDWRSEQTINAIRGVANIGWTIADVAEYFKLRKRTMESGIIRATPDLIGTFIKCSFYTNSFGRGVLQDSLRISDDFADLAHHLQMDSHRDARRLITSFFPQIKDQFNVGRDDDS